MPRVTSNPLAALLAVASAVLIVVGRVNRNKWWGNWVVVAGFAVLVVAAAFVVIARA